MAISNNRIVSVGGGAHDSTDDNAKGGIVRFKWRDYRDESKWKVMELRACEFIRRFLMHVLPPRFTKIRHYGLLGNRNKKEKVALCKKLTNTPTLNHDDDHDSKDTEPFSTADLIIRVTGIDITKCPACGSDNLHKIDLPPNSIPSQPSPHMLNLPNPSNKAPPLAQTA